MEKGRAVVVGVVYEGGRKGVFFGVTADDGADGKPMRLRGARQAVKWTTGGLLGLAADGPTKNCRIGPAADLVLHNTPKALIDVVIECSVKAVKAWGEARWV